MDGNGVANDPRLAFAEQAARLALLQNKRVAELQLQLQSQAQQLQLQTYRIAELQARCRGRTSNGTSAARRRPQSARAAMQSRPAFRVAHYPKPLPRPGSASPLVGIAGPPQHARAVDGLAPATVDEAVAARGDYTPPNASIRPFRPQPPVWRPGGRYIRPASAATPSLATSSRPSSARGRPMSAASAASVRGTTAPTAAGVLTTPGRPASAGAAVFHAADGRRLIANHPAAFLHGGVVVAAREPMMREPTSSAAEGGSLHGGSTRGSAHGAHGVGAGERSSSPRSAPPFTLTAFERSAEIVTRRSVRSAVDDDERALAAMAREVAIERTTDKRVWGYDDSVWTEFGGASLEPLLRIDEALGGEAPVRLLDAKFLIRLAERGSWLRARAHLPDDAFIDLPQLRLMRGAHAGLRILCVSHAWLQPDHPDSRRYTLQLLARALRILVEEGAPTHGGTQAVFLDFCCLHQVRDWLGLNPTSPDEPGRGSRPPNDIDRPMAIPMACTGIDYPITILVWLSGQGERVAHEADLFNVALTHALDLVSHPYTWVLQLTRFPRAYPRGYAFRPGRRPNLAPYHERGWTSAEAAASALVKVNAWQVMGHGRLHAHSGRRPFACTLWTSAAYMHALDVSRLHAHSGCQPFACTRRRYLTSADSTAPATPTPRRRHAA